MKLIIQIFSFFIFLLTTSHCFSFMGETHSKIVDKIVSYNFSENNHFSFDEFLKTKLNFQRGIHEPLRLDIEIQPFSIKYFSILDYLCKGAKREDFPLQRSLQHFHDPYLNIGLFGTFQSALNWAQEETQDYSWQQARNYYYQALTSRFQIDREYYFPLMFRSIGQEMHLVADMAVPEHTRNDAHPLSPGIELFIETELENNSFALNDALGNPIFFNFKSLQKTPSAFSDGNATVPIANIFDTNVYTGTNLNDTVTNTVGLSEYTNANFFSTDTNEVDGFPVYPYPELDITWMQTIDIPDPLSAGQTIQRAYFVKNTGEGETNNYQGYKLSAMDVLTTYAAQDSFLGQEEVILPLLDQYVLEDYGTLLLPRATGYAATLLNYFFRGQIEITPPEQGFYSLSNGEEFNEIRLKAKNITENEEQMLDGSIELVVKYKKALADPFQGEDIPVTPIPEYLVVKEKNGVTSIPTDQSIELTFELADYALPLWATDVTFQIVYRGKLGFELAEGFVGEEDAVAVGFKDVSEPTMVHYVNSMDIVCLDDQIMVAGSDEAITAVDLDGTLISSYFDVYSHGMTDNYLNISTQNNYTRASSNNYDVTYPDGDPNLYPGYYSYFYVIMEPWKTYEIINSTATFFNTDSNDSYQHYSSPFTIFFTGMINQDVYENGVWIRYYSGMSNFRNLKGWFGIFASNNSYPADNTCDVGASTIPLKGEKPFELFQY